MLEEDFIRKLCEVTSFCSVYDALTNRWNMIAVRGQPPCPRSNHAAVLMGDGLIVIHGGRHGSLRLSDTYVLQVPVCIQKVIM